MIFVTDYLFESDNRIMGIEIFQYGFPEDSAVIRDCVNGKLNGQVLQLVGQMLRRICDAEDGSEFIDDLGTAYPTAEKEAIVDALELVKASPHFLAVNFYGFTRGHDHWAYLLGLADQVEKEQARAVVFGSEPISESAVGSQGIPIRWSNRRQVIELDKLLASVDFDLIRKEFVEFPDNLYKRRSSDQLSICLQEIAQIATMYSRAAENYLAVVTILD